MCLNSDLYYRYLWICVAQETIADFMKATQNIVNRIAKKKMLSCWSLNLLVQRRILIEINQKWPMAVSGSHCLLWKPFTQFNLRCY